jgi:hypothetical protein
MNYASRDWAAVESTDFVGSEHVLTDRRGRNTKAALKS